MSHHPTAVTPRWRRVVGQVVKRSLHVGETNSTFASCQEVIRVWMPASQVKDPRGRNPIAIASLRDQQFAPAKAEPRAIDSSYALTIGNVCARSLESRAILLSRRSLRREMFFQVHRRCSGFFLSLPRRLRSRSRDVMLHVHGVRCRIASRFETARYIDPRSGINVVLETI